MKLNKVLQKIEYTTKETIAYYVIAFEKADKNKEKKVFNYLKELINSIEEIDKKDILEKIDTNLIWNFPIFWSLTTDEVFAYAIVIFDRLLKSNRELKKEDIVSSLKITMELYSTRTIIDEANRILKKIEKSSV